MPLRPAAVALRGSKVRTARERARLSQAQLARALGIDQSTLSRWETMSVLLLRKQADALAQALGVSLTSLVDDRSCIWCGEPQTSPSNPLVTVTTGVHAHRVACVDAYRASHRIDELLS